MCIQLGRIRETNDPDDFFAFRTPPLRNVTVTGPYMHNGAFSTLEAAIRHHLAPETSLHNYDVTVHLIPALQDTFLDVPGIIDALLDTRDNAAPAESLTEGEFADLMAFLAALTDTAAINIEPPPVSVPSGLPVDVDSADERYDAYFPFIGR